MTVKPTYEELEQKVKVLEELSAKSKQREREEQPDSRLATLLSPEKDVTEEEVRQIIDVDAIQELMNYFYKLTRIGIGIVDLKGNILIATGYQDICTKFHRIHPQTLKNCIESDIYLSANVEEGEYTIYKCGNNLWDMVTPIIAGGRHIANLFLGQFFFEDETPDYEVFINQAEKYGFNKDEYLAALEKVPRWSRETAANVMEFYTRLAEMIAKLSYSNTQLTRSLSEQKRVGVELRKSEEKFRGIYEESPIGIELYDREGTLLDVNRTCLDIFGISDVKAVKGVKLFENPNLSEECKAQLRRGESVRLEMPFDFERIRSLRLYETTKRGIIYLYVLITPLRSVTKEADIGYLVHTRDITDRKLAEEALRESETKYRRLHESMTEAYARVDMNGRIQESNRAFQTMLGYSEEELHHLAYSDITPEKWRALEKSIVEEQILVHGFSKVYEKEYQRKDGSVFPVELSSFLIRDNAGNPAGIWGIVRDITERKHTEAVLQESEKKYRQFFQTSRDFIFVTSKEGRIVDMNDAALELFGYSNLEELLKVKVPDLYVEPKVREILYTTILECGYVKEYPADLRRKDGSRRHTLITSVGRYDANGGLTGLQGTIRDVTEQRRNEEELRKYREKLEVMVAERTRELEDKTKNLQEVNTTLNILIKKREEDKKILEERFVANIGSLVLPYVEKIRKNNLDTQQQFCLDYIEKNLDKITSPLLKNIQQFNLTSREIQVASLIKDGKTTKEIAKALGIAEGSIDTHRKNIRKKLSLDRTSNLQSRLRFLEK